MSDVYANDEEQNINCVLPLCNTNLPGFQWTTVA